MYKLLIADDEDTERIGIKFLLEKYQFNFEITEASNGNEALEIIRKNDIDILFTDVKMPFLDGLELAVRAKEINQQLQIIFFSGYDDFDYVKQALVLQAVDYILKPVNTEEFCKVITTVSNRLDEERYDEQKQLYFNQNYVLTRLLNMTNYEQLEKRFSKEKLEFLKEYKRLILIEFEQDFFGNVIEDAQQLYAKFSDVFQYSFYIMDLNPLQAVMLVKEPLDENVCYKQMECLHTFIEECLKTKCYISISRQITEVQELGSAYREAERNLEERFFFKDIYIYPLDNKHKNAEIGSDNIDEILQNIEKDIRGKDVYSISRNVELLIEKCRNNIFESYIYTRYICANLLNILFEALPEKKEKLAENIERLYQCTNFSAIEVLLMEILQAVENNLLPKQDSPKRVIAIVEQYVYEHYMDVLSLDILAEKVYLTPHYLSNIFSQEKGIGLNKYIKNVRMEKAQELLLDTNMKISDICEKVGYSNVSYFCKTFRTEYGMTPEKYRGQ